MKLAENIAALRKKAELTQAQLAEKINMTSAAVSKWETGVASPDLDTLMILADQFRVSLDELLGRNFKRLSVVLFCIDGVGSQSAHRALKEHHCEVLGEAKTLGELESVFEQMKRRGESADYLISVAVGHQEISQFIFEKLVDLRKNDYYENWVHAGVPSVEELDSSLKGLVEGLR